MYPAGPAWPKLRVLRALWALLAVLLAPWRLWAKEDIQECIWHVVLVKFEAVGEEGRSDRFFDLEPLETLDSVFSLLVDAPTDQNEVRGLGSGEWVRSWIRTPLGSGHLPNLFLQKYLGFPYYLKINYSCSGEVSAAEANSFCVGSVSPICNILIVVAPPDPGDPKDSRRFPVSHKTHSRCSSKLVSFFFFFAIKKIEM